MSEKTKLLTLGEIKLSSSKSANLPEVFKFLKQYIDTYLKDKPDINTDNITFVIKKTLTEAPKFTNLFGLFSTSNKLFYVPLRLLIFFVNRFIQQSSTSSKFPNIDENSLQEYFTFDGYVNLAPHICSVKPKNHNQDLHPFKIEQSESNLITDILVNTNTFEKSLRDFIHSSEDPENFDIFTFFKSFLKQIETSLGGINEFDLEYSEDSNVFTIIDRKLPAPSVEGTVTPVINVYGAGSVALDISIQTKITNKLGNQIAIAAQGPNGEAQINSSMPEFKKWNKNLIDRFDIVNKVPNTKQTSFLFSPRTGNNTVLSPEISQNQENNFRDSFTFTPLGDPLKPVRISKPAPKTEEELENEKIKDRVESFRFKLGNLYNQWNNGTVDDDNGWDSLQVQGQTFYTMIASDFNTSIGLPPQGIIPTVLSLTVDGVGGVKIGQSFKISNGILPKRYRDFGYIVTGINHSIENNKWTTKIDAQTYYIGIPDEKEVKEAKDRLDRFSPFFKQDDIRRAVTSEDISQASQQRQAFNTAPVDTTSTTPPSTEIGPVDDNRRFFTLVAVCSREDGNPQGWADVAQSIYNRTFGGSSIGYKSDVVAQILGKWQYEPTWRFPSPGKTSIPNREWFQIKDLQTASIASGQSLSNLQEVVQALKNTDLQQNARIFVQGRTDFLGANEPANDMKQKVQRPGGNKFGFEWNWQPQNGGKPASVPGYVTKP